MGTLADYSWTDEQVGVLIGICDAMTGLDGVYKDITDLKYMPAPPVMEFITSVLPGTFFNLDGERIVHEIAAVLNPTYENDGVMQALHGTRNMIIDATVLHTEPLDAISQAWALADCIRGRPENAILFVAAFVKFVDQLYDGQPDKVYLDEGGSCL